MSEKELFLEKYPGYANAALDELLKTEFKRFDEKDYLDWVGSGQSPAFLFQKHADYLINTMLGNPHSDNFTSTFALNEVNETRTAILNYFNADLSEYEVVFTKNATEAILMMRHYQFEGGEYLLTADNHNSINGIREIAKRSGAPVRYTSLNDDLTLNMEELERALKYPRSTGNKLFAFPAKSNYSGNLHPLSLVKTAQDYGWDVLLDTAAFVANNKIDLSEVKPDFMPISFYKMFGYPTGIGCLIIKKSKYEKLPKRWFAGGSILIVSVMKDFFVHETKGSSRFEDGTINFAGIPAIRDGLQFIESLGNYKERVVAIASWLHDQLSPMLNVEMYSPQGNDTVAFNVKKGGKLINAWDFEKAASTAGIYVRTGCFCNPGINEKLFKYDIQMYEDFIYNSESPSDMTIDRLAEYADGRPVGSIRASFGYMNTFENAARFADFVRKFVKNL